MSKTRVYWQTLLKPVTVGLPGSVMSAVQGSRCLASALGHSRKGEIRTVSILLAVWGYIRDHRVTLNITIFH